MNFVSIIIGLLGIVAIVFGVFFCRHFFRQRKILEEKARHMERRMFELSILKELGDRIGYSLNVQNIVDIITGSLHQFIEYSAVSYMLLEPEKLIFKVHLEKSVSRKFINDIKDRMQKSLSALLNKDMQKMTVEEVLSGAIVVDETDAPVQSFFNIPLVIGEKVVGVLTVAHTTAGLYKEEETTILYKITRQASQAVTRLQEVITIEQRKLNAMVASITEGVVMTDRDYRVVVVNPVARQIIGLNDRQEVTIFDFIDRLGGKFDIRGRLEESVKLDKTMLADDVIIGDRSFQIFVSPVKGTIGLNTSEVLGGVVIFHDITHDKELEKLREDFTSMMVHELRSPLAAIKMMTQYLDKKKTGKSQKTQGQYNQLIQKNAVSMLNLVNDLLDVAKLESGRFEVHLEPMNIATTIKDKVAFYEPLAKNREIDLQVQLAANLPEEINGDTVRIGQVLGNLISNSLKYTHGGGMVTIQCFVHKKGRSWSEEAAHENIRWFLPAKNDPKLQAVPDTVVVAITDTGDGIAAANIPQLFYKLVQFRSRATDEEGQKGTGLGLVIAKGIVEAHNGTIGVASEESHGSTFYFTLPM